MMREIAEAITNKNFIHKNASNLPVDSLIFTNKFSKIKVVGKNLSGSDRILMSTKLNGKKILFGDKKEFCDSKLQKRKISIAVKYDAFVNTFLDKFGKNKEFHFLTCTVMNLKDYRGFLDSIDIILESSDGNKTQQTIFP